MTQASLSPATKKPSPMVVIRLAGTERRWKSCREVSRGWLATRLAACREEGIQPEAHVTLAIADGKHVTLAPGIVDRMADKDLDPESQHALLLRYWKMTGLDGGDLPSLSSLSSFFKVADQVLNS